MFFAIKASLFTKILAAFIYITRTHNHRSRKKACKSTTFF